MSVASRALGITSKAELSRTPGHPIVLPFPLPRTHCGFVLGNGGFGAMVWGEKRLHVTINRADFWDRRAGWRLTGEHLYEQAKQAFNPEVANSTDAVFEASSYPRPNGAFRNTRLPMGRFEFELMHDYTLVEGTLDVYQGTLLIELFNQTTSEPAFIELALHPSHHALLISDPSQILSEVTARPAWLWVSDAMQSRGFDAPRRIEGDQYVGWTQECPSDPAVTAICQSSLSTHIIVAELADNAEASSRCAFDLIRQVDRSGPTVFVSETTEWWQRYSDQLPDVHLPDPFFNDFLQLAIYKFGAATSPASGIPCALQGPWCEEYQLPPWSGDYHFNINIQQIYTLAFAIGKHDHLLPLFDMLDQNKTIFQGNAKALLDIDDGLLITHTTDDHGYACGGLSAGACLDQAVSGWTAQLYWMYYQHTGDEQFLHDRAMPFMTAVMRTFEAMLEWENGKPTLPLSISAEYGHPLSDGSRQRAGADPSSQLSCMHMLIDAITQATNILDLPANPNWLKLRDKLPHWTLVGDAGEKRIGIWKDTDLTISHRHHSHLSCIYPFDTIRERTKVEDKIIANSIDRWLEVGMSDWSEWCYPWAAIIQAREGFTESPYQLLKLCRDLFINEGMSTGYIPRFKGFTLHGLRWLTGPLDECEIMQLDGTMGIATALLEMLVHTHNGVTRFFPAVPKEWKDISFHNIHLPGQFVTSGEMKNGKVRSIKIESRAQGEMTIDIPDCDRLKIETQDTSELVHLPHTLSLTAGQTVTGEPLYDE